MKHEPQITGNVGLYYVCYKLSCLGWNVMPTSRNARGIDIIAYDRSGKHFVGIQVKSLSKRDPVPLGAKLDNIGGDYWVIVTKVRENPTAYIMKPKDVKDLAQRGEKDGKISYWLQPKSYDQETFKEQWQRII